jgi:hypothetical protein
VSRSSAAAIAGFVLCTLALGSHGTDTARAEATQRRERVYMAQLSMVLEGARRLMLWAETYPADTDFARFAYPLSERYVEMAGHMVPPGKLAVVHPHLLLVVENVERAMAAAANGDMPSFRQRTRTVREELSSLDGVLKQLKLRLPELSR